MTAETKPVSMFARLNGEVVSRLRKCKQGHSFTQNQISPEWLASKSDGARDLYIRDYELEKRNGSYWMPGLCHACRGRKP